MAVYSGFFAAVSVIIVSELGDKTFFIAAIMAMNHSRLAVFFAAISALAMMTILSVSLGLTTSVIPKIYTHYISIVLFIIFGLKMLYEAYGMSGEEAKEELDEIQRTLRKNQEQELVCIKVAPSPTSRIEQSAPNDGKEPNGDNEQNSTEEQNGGQEQNDEVPKVEELAAGRKEPPSNKQTEYSNSGTAGSVLEPRKVPFGTRIKRWFVRYIPIAFLETLTMTLVAEWGDRSQISTIILAAKDDPVSVTLGAIFGHAICSMIAVIGGRMVAQRISVRTVTFIGGFIFILFAMSALVTGEN